ncbi:putative beta-glucosidase L [Mycena kentingensis (nom. inval.)]|nr:putative beta-glucosidase L [Mycena kentingensis (nom. inval.)]
MVRNLLRVALVVLVEIAQAVTLRTWDEAYKLATTTVGQLTIQEKAGLVAGVGQFDSRCVGDTTAIDRLGIPAICFQDGPAGVRMTQGVTGFPTGINTASTFSRRLMRARGVALGEEFRDKGIHVFLGPAMDIMRNPKGGRAWESFGPDPYLNGEGAFYTITGVQSVGVQACAKHFAANNQERWRYGANAVVDDRTMHETYLYPFIRAIEAEVTSVMCAYNQVNGTSSCHNAALLGKNGLLRAAGFKGYVVSDWGATHDGVADNANAGLDMEQPGDNLVIGGGIFGKQGHNVVDEVNEGSVPAERLDEMATRILAGFYKVGQDNGYTEVSFDVQHSDGSGPLNLGVDVRSDAHTALAREIAAASAVLLKNNRKTASDAADGDTIRGLPLSMAQIKTMAVIGMDAAYPKMDCDNMNKCNDGTMSIGWGSGANFLGFIVPPVKAIEDYVGNAVDVTTSLTNDVEDGANAARGKDVCLVFANAMSGELLTYAFVDGNLGDRNDLDLWYDGDKLIQGVADVCENTIAVVHSVGPINMAWSDHPNIKAIIYAGAPGEQTGPGLVDVLFGDVNPSGRLPFSIDDNESSYGTEIVTKSLKVGFPKIEYKEQLLLDYRYMDSKNIVPRYEFGFGLSYTTFNYSDLHIVSTASGCVNVSFMVTNNGTFAGTEKPQLYLSYPESAGEPKRVLRGFEEVGPLQVGESAPVTMEIAVREMSFWDVVSQSWVRPDGTFNITIGASIRDVRLSGTFGVGSPQAASQSQSATPSSASANNGGRGRNRTGDGRRRFLPNVGLLGFVSCISLFIAAAA